MSDPLSLVRQATITRTPVNYVDHHYIFGSHKIHESTKTCFKRTLKADDVYYTVRDVIFFLENAEVSVAEYRRLCVEKKVAPVVEIDKPNLKSYLLGEIETCHQIDLAVAAASVVQSSSNEVAATPQISSKEMQEQRQRHAALIDQSMQKASTVALNSSSSSMTGVSAEKLDELRLLRRSQKRKVVQMGGNADIFDPAFIKADKQLLLELRADEYPAQTRATVLCKPGADFSFALKLFNDYVLRPKDHPSATAAAAAASTNNRSSKSSHHPVHSNNSKIGANGGKSSVATQQFSRPFCTPIIIVPATTTSIISKVNAVELLEKGVYVPITEVAPGSNSDQQRISIRKIHASNSVGAGYPIEYKIVDNPATQMRPEDWDRVVAVFATGQAWQFKGWKWSNPVDIFNEVLGLHLTMDDRVVPTTIQNWKCKLLKINQFKRHMDASAINDFWASLEEYVRLHKPWLLQAPAGAKRPGQERGLSTGKSSGSK